MLAMAMFRRAHKFPLGIAASSVAKSLWMRWFRAATLASRLERRLLCGAGVSGAAFMRANYVEFADIHYPVIGMPTIGARVS